MKICIDISQIVYGTGVSNYTNDLVENLLKIDHNNQYKLFGYSLRLNNNLREYKKKFLGYENVEFRIIHIPISAMTILWNRLHIVPIEKFVGEFDLLHSSDWIQPPVRSSKAKKITTVHDMAVYLFSSFFPSKILENQKRRMNFVINEVDRIISVSQSTKDDIEKFLKVPTKKINVISLASSPIFKPQDEEKINVVLNKFKIKKPFILSVATQEPRKNIQILLDVFEQIVKKRANVSLVLSGKYGWGPGLRSSENVIWTDYVSKEDLVVLYSSCRVFVYPSLYEGFGLPILEAMACGAPVITSNNSSMVEIAKEAAILIDPRSEGQLTKAIDMVLDLNLDNYQKMVKASLERARQYSWAKTARETLKVYEEVAGTSD